MSTVAMHDDSLFKVIVILSLAAFLHPGNANRQVFKLARKFQRETDCKTTRNVMERLTQSRDNCAEMVLKTYAILREEHG